MKLRAIRLHDVRQFAGRGVALEDIADGLNSFAQPNETGKSTFFDSLQELLFKKHTSKDRHVHSLQPYVGGNPHIAADVEVDSTTYTIEKRFMGRTLARVTDRTTGSIIAQQDHVTEWLNDTLALGDQGAGPAGLLWVRQGKPLDQGGGSTARGATLSDMVAEQLDAVTAGERMRAVMERTATELATLVTPAGKPKTGGAYADVVAEVDTLVADEAQLAERHEGIRRDLDERIRVRGQLEALRSDTDEIERQRQRLVEAERTESAATADLARHEEMTGRLTAARTLHDQAVGAFEQFLQARTAAGDLQARMTETRAHLPALEKAATEAATALQAAGTRMTAAQEAEQQADAAYRAAVSAQRAEDQARQLDALRKTEADARAALERERESRATASLIAVDAATLDQVEKAAQEVEFLTARAEADATQITVTYAPGRSGAITAEGTAIADGAPLSLSAPTILNVDGIGTIAIVPGGVERAREAEGKLGAAKADLAKALRQAGADTPQAARAALDRKTALLNDADTQRQIAHSLAPGGLDDLQTRIAAFEAAAQASDPDAEADSETARTALDAAQADRKAAATTLDIATQQQNTASTNLRDAQTSLKMLENKREAELSRTGPEAEWETRSVALAKAIATYKTDIDTMQETLVQLDDAAQRKDLATAEIRRLKEAEQNRSAEVHRLELRLAQIESSLGAAIDDEVTETLQTVRAKLDTARTRLARIEGRVRALQRLDDALKNAHREMREVYFKPVNAELRPLLRQVLKGEGLIFDDDSFEPRALNRAGTEEAVERLSGGTQEQIAILTRLAFARLIARNGRPTPVILDDALIFTDDDRIEDMFTILQSMTQDLQILVLTCRQRAFQSMGGAILSLTEWRPPDD